MAAACCCTLCLVNGAENARWLVEFGDEVVAFACDEEVLCCCCCSSIEDALAPLGMEDSYDTKVVGNAGLLRSAARDEVPSPPRGEDESARLWRSESTKIEEAFHNDYVVASTGARMARVKTKPRLSRQELNLCATQQAADKCKHRCFALFCNIPSQE